jgi:hypothetical protein
MGIEMPPDFPLQPYDNIRNRLVGERDKDPESWGELASAWNAIAYRFCSCAEHDETFSQSVRRAGNSPPGRERYIQERELFCFFVTGMSAIECLCYGLFAIGSMLDKEAFPFVTIEDRKAITPERTASRFRTTFSRENITSTLKRLTESQDYQRWRTIRNILSHRSTPGRQFFRGGARDGEAVWGEIMIDQNTTVSRRRWLAGAVRDLLEATDSFTVAQF